MKATSSRREALSDAVNERLILRLAGEAVYRRGEDYYLHGHVVALAIEDHTARATVRDKQPHEVRLGADEGILDYSCDCTEGSRGDFCKHCAAAAFACLETTGRKRGKSGRRTRQAWLAEAEEALLAADKDVIVHQVLEWAKSDEGLRERLLMYAVRRQRGVVSLAAVGRAFERAARIRGFVPYREMPTYARRVNRAIDSIAELLEHGQPAGVIGLCESALALLENNVARMDDSSGYMRELFDRLEGLHHRACLEAPPDGVEFARRLFGRELQSDYDIFCDAASRYREVLGPKGLAEYRVLAEAEWAKVPLRGSADRKTWGQHFRISRMMENLAQLSGNTEELVGVLSRDLSSAYQYVRIAETYRAAADYDKAVEWAERGLRAFPERTDSRLREFLADEYHRRNRHAEAMPLIWSAFHEQPTLVGFESLQKHAESDGSWDDWRERALGFVRGQIQTAEAADNRSGMRLAPRADRSLLVEIYLAEGDVQSAWREAQQGGCSRTLWMRIAAQREKDHPEQAATVYLTQAEFAVATATNSNYVEGVKLLIKAASVMKRLGRSREFADQVANLRGKFKLKRNFLRLLDEAKAELGV